ncbi:hypothetical protein ACWD5Q_08595 [Streptomyces sp. NPDC002513]
MRAAWARVPADAVVAEAQQRGEVAVTDTREAARSVVVQPLWPNCLALLGGWPAPEAVAGV